MIKLKRSLVEKAIGKSLRSKLFAWGIDTASRTGWACAVINGDDVHIDCGFIKVDSQDLYFKYNQFIKSFESLFSDAHPELKYKLVIEDTFFGKNVNTLKLLSRIGMIAYITGKQAGIQDISFIYPTASRKLIGIKSTLKKAEVHKELVKMLGIKLDDEDVADAIVLAIGALVEENTLI